MRQLTCNVCGETTHLLERGEVQVRETSKETPLDHMKRTGHDPREPPHPYEQRACGNCGNVWWYGGDADRPTCPNCKGKATRVVEEQND